MKRRTRFLIIIIPSLLVLLAAIAGILESVASTQILQTLTPSPSSTLLFLGVVVLVLIGFTLWWNRLSAKKDDLTLTAESRSSPPLLPKTQSREELLGKVYTYWITGKFEPSLNGVSPLSLGLKDQPDAVANPFEPLQEESKRPGRSHPPETSILQIYDRAKKALLILGEPGSGKTTLILQLAEKLQARALQKETEPMPVVLELSSWSGKEQSLTAWILEEMKTKYNVPRDLSQSWINDGQIALLLDGLDEIPKKHRRMCIKAINEYRQTLYGAAVVVSTRSAEYRNESDRLDLLQAVEVQPVEERQLDEYLSRNSEQLAIVGAMLREDPELRKMVTTPLALAVLRRVYHGKSVEDLLTDPLETRRHRIAEAYCQYMFEYRRTSSPYTPEKTKQWLAWLAEQIKLDPLAPFSIERIRPTSLPDGWVRRLYFGLNWGLALGMGMGVFIGLIVGLIVGFISSWDNAFGVGIVILFIAEFFFGLVIGPLFGVVVLPFIHFDPWLQQHSIWPVESEIDEDVSLWGFASFGVGVIAWGVVSTLAAMVLVVGFWLLITLPQNFILFIKQNPFLSSRPVGISISVLIVAAYVIFIIYYCIKIIKEVVKLISRVRIENEEMVAMWFFDKPAHALLCLFFYFAGCLPLNYPRFLDYVAEHTLLHKVQVKSHPETQNNYTFVHPLLLEYFAGINAADTYFQKGCDFRDLAREEEALLAFEQALHFSPTRSDIHYYKGKTFFTLKRYEEALLAFEQAIRLDPDDSDNYYWKGMTLRYLDRQEETLLAFEQATHLDPNDSDNYYWKGVALDTLHRYEEALLAFDQAIHLKPKWRYAYSQKANTLFALNRYEEALLTFDQAIRLDSGYARAYSNRGYALYRLNRYKEALAAYEQAIHLDPNDFDNYYWKGVTLRYFHRYEEALLAFNQAIHLNPKESYLCSQKADTLFTLKRYEEALLTFEQAIHLDPDDSDNYYWKGRTLRCLHRYEGAMLAFDRALHLNPKDPYAYIEKGRVLYVLHHYEEALSVLDEAIHLDPKLAETYRIRSKIYLGLEKSEEAKRDLEEAQKLLNEESELQDPEKTQKLIGDKK